MKKRISIYVFALLILLCYITRTVILNMSDDDYVYPLSPQNNPQEWQKLLEKGEDMYALVDIPEKELRKMSTEKLLRAVLDYPFSINIAAYNSYQTAYNVMYQSFSGLRELMSRSDAAEILLKKYRNFDYSIPYENLEHLWMEVFLAQDEILDKVDIKLLEDIVSENINKQITGIAFGKLSGASFLLDSIQRYKEK